MGVAKVTFEGNTLIDVTSKTVTSSTMLSGTTALDKAGEPITGTYENGSYLTAFTKYGGGLTEYSSPGSNSGMKTVTFPDSLSYLRVTPSSEWQDFIYGNDVTVITQIDSGTNPNSTTYTKTVNVGSSTLADYRGDLVLRAQAALLGDEIVEREYFPIMAKIDDEFNLIEFPEQSFKFTNGTLVNVNITTSQTTISITATRTIMLVNLDFITTPKMYDSVSVAPAPSFYDITIYGNYGSYVNRFVEYSGSRYYSQSDVIHVTPGDSINICTGSTYKVGNEFVSSSNTSSATYTYTPTNGGQVWWFPYITASTAPAGISAYYAHLDEYVTPISTLTIKSSNTDVYGYRTADVGGNYGIALDLLLNGRIYSSGNTAYNYTSNDVIAFCNSFSKISSSQFTGKALHGEFTFPNARSVYDYGFAWAYTTGGGGGVVDGVINLPSVSSLSHGAFAYNKTIDFVSLPLITNIPPSTFYMCNIGEVYLPNCISIGSNAFNYGNRLKSISFPECTTINERAFMYCFSLSSVYLPKCVSIKDNVFSGCSSLTTIDLPEVTSIGYACFSICKNLTSINAPKCISISSFAFASCTNLYDVSFPLCSTVGNMAFGDCTSLVSIYLPSCISIGISAFVKDNALTTVSIPICSSIGTYAFQSCYNLISVYINNVSSVPTLGNHAFISTPISNYSASAGRYGSVFVPTSLYSAFLTATNWVSISSRIVGV